MAKPRRDRRALGPQVKPLKRCLADEARERAFRAEAEDLLESPDTPPVELAFRLHGLGAWATARGLLGLLDGDPGGAAHVCTGWRYSALYAAVLHALAPAKPPSWMDLNLSARCLPFALATGRDRYAAPDSRAVEDPGRNWSLTPVERLTLVVYGFWSGRPIRLPPGGRSGGAAATDIPALAASLWRDEDRFPSVLGELLRARMSHAGTYLDPFDDLRDGVLPVEFLAIGRVRRGHGLLTPFPAHPLLESPVVGLAWVDGGSDGLLMGARAFCEGRLPGIDSAEL